MTAKRYYIVEPTPFGLIYYCGLNIWTAIKEEAAWYLSEESACIDKEDIKQQNKGFSNENN